MPVEINDILLVPVYDPVISNNNRITIKWSENLRERTADYYVLVAKKQSKSKKSLSNMVPRNKVCFIIAAEWYEGESDNPQHLNNVATKTKDGKTSNIMLVGPETEYCRDIKNIFIIRL
jgi:hypothetical protein